MIDGLCLIYRLTCLHSIDDGDDGIGDGNSDAGGGG